ncbi:TatD family hydrolase [Marisediminicola senii]|uniref:TatD family hydrolase n=1 Tax=Marisediminicola senii TaxID=2711233 RepID=UPI0013ED66B0|nr:TatD family hydrolase [Marisediminicola senii]
MTDGSNYIRQRESRAETGQSRDLSYPPLPPALVVPCYDNHTHLEIADGDDPLDYLQQLDMASSVGIRGVVQVGGDVETSRWSAEMAAREPRMLAAVAIHPNEAPRYEAAGTLDDAIAQIDELAGRPRVRAVGETGLDFFRTEESGRGAQHRSFEAHIAIAKKHDLAMQIHDRDAHDAVIETLLRVGAPERTVFHCFSGDADMARLCADNGWYLSFAGNITFKNAGNLREALEVVPRDRILVETDAPFLTPAPLRGRPNSPYLIPYTLRFMADHLGTDVSVLAAQISSNTELVYGQWDAEPVSGDAGSPWDDAVDPAQLA